MTFLTFCGILVVFADFFVFLAEISLFAAGSLPKKTLGSYEYGAEVNFKIESHGRTFDFYYNGKKAASVRAEGDYEDSYICSHKIGINSPKSAKNFFSDCYFSEMEME